MHLNLQSSSNLIAVALIIGSALVAGALYQANTAALAKDTITIQRADASERHLNGSRRAETVIVEFSDYQCPFCSQLHTTLQQIIEESGGTIAWEYRHLPLGMHDLAGPAALASECIAKNLNNEAFWEFTDDLFMNQQTLSAESIENKQLELGLTPEQILACQSDSNINQHIQNDMEAAATLGGSGTPFSVIIFPDNSYKTVSGAVPYEQWKNLLQ